MIALLSGGTGGAKLARGFAQLLGDPADLAVIANVGDDVWVYGVHVSPDPDLVTYWLADLIDDRGFGIRGDSWRVMEALERRGQDTWFRLGDQDLALCLLRTERLRAGQRQTVAQQAVADALGVRVRVLPATDQPLRTRVRAAGAWLDFQEFMIRRRAQGPIEAVEFEGAEKAAPTREVTAALASARLIVIGPSNPVISIGPILAIAGVRAALADRQVPAIAVSPFVGGRAVKGPTDDFCRFAGIEASASGVARAYAGLIDGIVADEPVRGLPHRLVDTLMDDEPGRLRVARAVLELALELGAVLPPTLLGKVTPRS